MYRFLFLSGTTGFALGLAAVDRRCAGRRIWGRRRLLQSRRRQRRRAGLALPERLLLRRRGEVAVFRLVGGHGRTRRKKLSCRGWLRQAGHFLCQSSKRIARADDTADQSLHLLPFDILEPVVLQSRLRGDAVDLELGLRGLLNSLYTSGDAAGSLESSRPFLEFLVVGGSEMPHLGAGVDANFSSPLIRSNGSQTEGDCATKG